jgi:hypothetical protein
LKVLYQVSRRRKNSILILPSWKGQVWSSLLKNLTISTIPLGKSEKVLAKGKAMKKRDLQLPPGLLVKEFIIWYQRQGIQILDPYGKGKGEYCGSCNLLTIQ